MRIALVLTLLVACGDSPNTPSDGRTDGKTFEDAGIDAAIPLPATLFDTGLCVDRACTTISPDVMEYTPQFPLYADTATKRRWFKLPPGTKIDTTDMDHWIFPVGTTFWKEFTRGGTRVETRMIRRIYEADSVASWQYVSYQWNATNDDTTQADAAGVMNANGTQHDIPSVSNCKSCHENLKPTRILGFGAIQLDAPGVNADDITLHKLVDLGLLTTNPPAAASSTAPFYPIEGSAAVIAGMGYVHANCSHCHNPTSVFHNNTGLELRLLVGEVHDHAQTAAYRTAVGKAATSGDLLGQITDRSCSANSQPAPCVIKPMDKTNSIMYARFEFDRANDPQGFHMPQLGTEMIDANGTTILTNWIANP